MNKKVNPKLPPNRRHQRALARQSILLSFAVRKKAKMDCFARVRNDDVTRVSLYAVWYYTKRSKKLYSTKPSHQLEILATSEN